MEYREFTKLWKNLIAGRVVQRRGGLIFPAITRVDEKGRLRLPTEFKRTIAEKYGTKFYITSLDGKVAKVYPLAEWERIEQKVASPSNSNPTKKDVLDRVRYYGHRVKMDGRGRLLIPHLLREAAQIRGEVVVIGNLTHLIVRNWEAYRKEIEEQQRDFRADWNAPVFAPLKPKPHLRSGAMALPEPTYPDDAFTVAELEKQMRSGTLQFKVGEKGVVSVYGLGRFPVTLYYEQWVRLLDATQELRDFIEMHKTKLKLMAFSRIGDLI